MVRYVLLYHKSIEMFTGKTRNIFREKNPCATREKTETQEKMYRRYFKRAFDFCAAFVLVVALLPVYVVLAVLVRLNMGAGVLFVQERPGLNGKIFKLYKFRTMTNAADKDGNLLPDAQRITGFGAFLRKTSLDELPQFFNVLKGDMSFIGPRPLLVRYLPYYTAEESLRHSVRPGITGLAQINGRNALSWDERLAFDVAYAKNITFLGDLKIAAHTVLKVLKRSDITVGKEEFLDVERRGKIGR